MRFTEVGFSCSFPLEVDGKCVAMDVDTEGGRLLPPRGETLLDAGYVKGTVCSQGDHAGGIKAEIRDSLVKLFKQIFAVSQGNFYKLEEALFLDPFTRQISQ
uniref:Uncharacterized protein n=1 Tax=Lepeophtheirus salmonis TaxID=72036 RepID=A0A0K2T9V6_LEPSM